MRAIKGARERSSAALALASLLVSGCGSFLGASFVPPPELASDAHRYDLLVDYQSFATDQPKRRVGFTPAEDPDTSSPGPCRFAFDVTGTLKEEPSQPATREGELWVWRNSSRFDYRIEAPPTPRVELRGTLERTATERVDERALRELEAPPPGAVTVDPDRVSARVGHGQLFFGGEPAGELELDSGALVLRWGEARYMAQPRGYAAREVRSDGVTVLYAKLDAGHWGVGERAYHVAVDPSLDCERLQRAVSVLLMAQLFAGD